MLKKNVLYNTLYQLVNMIIPIITAPYLSRVLGAEGIGVSSYSRAVAGYFVLFAMLGVNNYGNRSIALSKDNRKNLSNTFFGIYQMQFAVSIIILMIYLLFAIYSDGRYKLAFIISIMQVLSAIFDINWLYFGLGEFRLTTTRSMLLKLISTISIFGLVKEEKDVYKYIAIYAASCLISNLIMWIYLKKYVDIVYIPFKEWKRHIRPNLVLFIPAIAVSIYKMMDKVMLGNMTNAIQNGYYECTSNIVTIPLSVITAMGLVMLPKISELVKSGEFDIIERYNLDTIQIMLGCSIPFALGIAGVSDSFVELYLGKEFIDSAPVLEILALSSPFVAMGNVLRTQFIIPRKRDKVYVIATIMGAVVNLSLNLLLIPIYGAIGAAIGTLGAEATVMIYQFIKMHIYINTKKVIKDNYIFFIAGIFMYYIVILIQKSFDSSLLTTLVLQIVCGIITYFLIVIIYFILFDQKKFLYWAENLKLIKIRRENINERNEAVQNIFKK